MTRCSSCGFVFASLLFFATAHGALAADPAALREKARNGSLTAAEQAEFDAAMKARTAERDQARGKDRSTSTGRPTSRNTPTTGGTPAGTRPTGGADRPKTRTAPTGTRPGVRPMQGGTRPAVVPGRPQTRGGQPVDPMTSSNSAK